MPLPSHDLHLHTYLSLCCHDRENQQPAKIITLAEEMGLDAIGFADHMWLNPDLEPSDWYRPQDERQIARIKRDLADVETDLTVLVGCEAEMVAPGRFGITPETAGALDFVLLTCSHFHMKAFVEQPPDDSPRALADHMLRFFVSGVKSGLATAIAHPFLPLGHYHNYDEAVALTSDAEFIDAFGVAAEFGVGIEVTLSYFPPEPPTWSIETPIRFLSLAKSAGCKFTFGSDAHAPERQRQLPELRAFIEAVGITEDDVLTVPRAST